MKNFLKITILILLFINNVQAEYVDRVQWEKDPPQAYKECGIFGFFCDIYMPASSNKLKASHGSYIKVYNQDGKEIDNFMVKTIYYEKDKKRCYISKQLKEEPETYLTVHNCTKVEKSERDKKSDINRKKSKIKLSCKMDKVHVVKKSDGTPVDVWYDKKFIKKNLAEIAKPVIYETNKENYPIWVNESGTISQYQNENGFGYINESDAKEDGYITIHFISINYLDLSLKSEHSLPIKDDDSRFNYNFNNKPEISSIGYGECKKIKWEY
jgi:hypothetical protein